MPPAGPIIAHRGASAAYPENTITSLQMAQSAGCEWAEIDVQVTADGTPLLMHDHTVDRTTTGTGPVAMMQANDILRLQVLHPLTGAPSTVRPPLLEDVLSYCSRSQLGLVLEIKATWGVDAEDARRVAALIPPEVDFPLLITSFSVEVLRTMADLRPDLALGLACLRPPVDPDRTAKALSLSAIHCNADFVRLGDIAAMREAGLDIAVATVNDPDRARFFLDAGVHGVMSDHPDLIATP